MPCSFSWPNAKHTFFRVWHNARTPSNPADTLKRNKHHAVMMNFIHLCICLAFLSGWHQSTRLNEALKLTLRGAVECLEVSLKANYPPGGWWSAFTPHRSPPGKPDKDALSRALKKTLSETLTSPEPRRAGRAALVCQAVVVWYTCTGLKCIWYSISNELKSWLRIHLVQVSMHITWSSIIRWCRKYHRCCLFF